MSDYGFAEYETIARQIDVCTTHTDVVTMSRRVTRFVQDRDHNPVYSETLVNLLMAKGYDVIEDATSEVGQDTWALMATRRIARNVLTTVSAWRVIMDNNASGPEG